MPFGSECEYEDMAACVRANSDKDDPEGYCAKLMRETKGHCAKNEERGAGVDLSGLTNLSGELAARAHTRAPRRTGQSWYRISNAADGDTAEIMLYDMIGEWGVTAQEFVNELKSLTAPNIDLRINCKGGEVYDGVAIYSALLSHPANITGYVDGVAASAASFIAMAPSKLIMAKNATMWIHDAHGLCVGNARDMTDTAKILDEMSNNIAGIYADKAGGTVEEWRARMTAGMDGTQFNARQAVDAGLADEVATDPRKTGAGDAIPSSWNWDPQDMINTIRKAVQA